LKLLLDTHALLWFVIGNSRISAKAKNAIESFDNEVFVSAASAWEVTTKVRIGKLPEAERFAAEFRDRIKELGFQEFAVSVDMVSAQGSSPGTTKTLLTECSLRRPRLKI
jgi:PIN domain nuclease of toxin-antitoxin system